MKLSELKKGERGKIVALNLKGALKKRFQEMGILPGEEVSVERVAPLGDPVDIYIKGYHLSLRKEEAEGIEVEVLK
ncbi:MAG: ferrous iron transport protein A [Caldimicrobium sp.]|nr:ferrous iron transport protein A [Caldimicrobium sp.]MCX7614056.1 ferrous iron transport protein A [Caldimicrobium sp.]MDW8182693.1 FeoA family protein [Caldimicrobium sp.]